VLHAVHRVGSRALKSGAMIALALLAFVAIFFSHVPFPLIVLAAGMIGFIGARNGSAAFTVGGGHGEPGKVSAGESEVRALARELHEELGIEVIAARPFMRLTHAYADRDVELSLWLVERYAGEPRPLDQQQLKWVVPAHLGGEDILEADRPFIEALRDLPRPR